MAENVRERFTVDLPLEEGVLLSDHERHQIAENILTIASVLIADVLKEKGAEVIPTNDPVVYGHRHESTRSNSCMYCLSYADDRRNSHNIS